MTTVTILKTVAALLGILGIYITYKIRFNKTLHKSGQKMVCLPGHKCDEVIFSDYSKFFGINLEIMGFVYYASATLFYLVYLFLPSLITELISFVALGITFGGFIFSIYLTYIQIFKLKSLCSWCLLSALSSTVIFFTAYTVTMISVPGIFVYIEQLSGFIKTFEIITLVFGVAIFTFLEILIFTFLKDFNLTIHESNKIKTTAQIGWFVLFLFILNNIGLYLPQYFNTGLQIGQTLISIELLIVIFIIVNNAISTINILPELQKESIMHSLNKKVAEEKNNPSICKIKSLKRITTFQSILSLILWYGLAYLNLFF